ncbi:MAG: hypothetical protein FWC57_00380, partial [Endomicrobia bacterium]|nr:hypothetical protein [Endomicrobiia bacterium]
MKKISSFVLAALFMTTAAALSFAAPAAPAFKPFAVYVENNSKENHFAPSGWMGDYGDLKLNLASTEMPRSGNTCIKITYSAKMAQGAGWSGIYW